MAREIHADLSAQTLARSRGHQGLFQRMEFVRTGQIRHQQRQKARTAHADHLQPHSRDGFCRPLRTAPAAAAARGLHRAVRPLHFHRVCARRGPRLPAGMGARAFTISPRCPDLTFFFKADLEVSLNRILDGRPEAEIFRGGHGSAAVHRSVRKLPHFPGPHPGAIPGDEHGVQLSS